MARSAGQGKSLFVPLAIIAPGAIARRGRDARRLVAPFGRHEMAYVGRTELAVTIDDGILDIFRIDVAIVKPAGLEARVFLPLIGGFDFSPSLVLFLFFRLPHLLAALVLYCSQT